MSYDFKVSVRLMTFNHQDYISKAMHGILNQRTNFRIEIVVGDDFSTDDTLEIVRSFKETENIKIRILERPVEGEYWVNRNKRGRLYNFIDILKNCSGKYIALLDGDDYWTDPLKLQRQVDALDENSNINICSHASKKLDSISNEFIGTVGFWGNKKKIIPFDFTISNFGAVCPMQSIMIRNTQINELSDLIIDAPGAHGILQLFYSHNLGVIYLPKSMSVYRVNSSTSLMKNVVKKKGNYNKWIVDTIEKLKELNIYFEYKWNEKFENKIKYYQFELITSNLVSSKEKKELIKNNPKNFKYYVVCYLYILFYLKKFKLKFYSLKLIT